MRIVSLVPSWTETLIQAGLNVVGRTGYCVFPQGRVESIPVVGGTKNVHWRKVQKLQPDLLIFDKEENPKEIADECPYPFWVSHVQNVENLVQDFKSLSVATNNQVIADWGVELNDVLNRPPKLDYNEKFPGLIEWLVPPKKAVEKVLYLIWKDPWMCVSPQTYIGSSLNWVFEEARLVNFPDKYPQISLKNYDSETTLLLLSSEPYDFLKEKNELKDLGFASALINGRDFSWFGVHGLRFLREAANGR